VGNLDKLHKPRKSWSCVISPTAKGYNILNRNGVLSHCRWATEKIIEWRLQRHSVPSDNGPKHLRMRAMRILSTLRGCTSPSP